jgi:hypothetical protein
MKHLLMGVYQVCPKIGPAGGREEPIYRWATSGPSWPSCLIHDTIMCINCLFLPLSKSVASLSINTCEISYDKNKKVLIMITPRSNYH